MTENEFLARVESGGGRLYIVGGWVRDRLRGAAGADKDYVAVGLSEADFYRLFPDAVKVGESFPVFLLTVDGGRCEVALARREAKCGRGYKGFRPLFGPDTTIEEDLARRDTTINSMALDVRGGGLLDPFGGAADINRRVIRAVSARFKDDPVRALRAARQAAQLGFAIDGATLALMGECRDELAQEPSERLAAELHKALAAAHPAAYFLALQRAGLLAAAYPQLHALVGQTQPAAHHPEGDAFVHSLQVLAKVAAVNPRPEVRFAALTHDLGKGLTPRAELPHHYGHDQARGLAALEAFNRRMTLPKRWLKCAAFAITAHMRVTRLKKPGKIVALLLAWRKNPIGDGFIDLIRADGGQVLPDCLRHADVYLAAIRSARGGDAPTDLPPRAVGGWLRQKQIEKYLEAKRALAGA